MTGSVAARNQPGAAASGRWAAWNGVRVAGSLAAFGCLAWALVVQGREMG
jgi:hypothetical protein